MRFESEFEKRELGERFYGRREKERAQKKDR